MNVSCETLGRDQLLAKVEKALSLRGTHTTRDIGEAIERGEMQPWFHGEAHVVTKLVRYPQLTECVIILAAGNIDDVWQIMETMVEPWAKECGCRQVKSEGRPGWEKSAQERGYGNKQILMTKELR